MPDPKPDPDLEPSTQLYHAKEVLKALVAKREGYDFFAPWLFLLSLLCMVIATRDSMPIIVSMGLYILSAWSGYMCWHYATKSTVSEFEEFAEDDVERLTNMIEVSTDRLDAMHGLTVAEDADRDESGLSMAEETPKS